MTLVIGTRGSALALAQARGVAAALAAHGCASRLEIISTQGDRMTDVPLDKMVGKGFFTKEIEVALLGGAIDMAVHSLKDLPSAGPDGLTLAAIPTREDPRDCLVMRPGAHAPDAPALPLGDGARVGTSAVRRRSQLAHLRPDLEVVDLRGNVGTRVQRVRAGELDAAVLAQAGLSRLDLDLGGLTTVALAPECFVPAPAQGALGLQVRLGDTAAAAAVLPLHAAADAGCVALERALLARLGGGCHVPLGALVRPVAAEDLALLGYYRGRVARVVGPAADLVDRAALALDLR